MNYLKTAIICSIIFILGVVLLVKLNAQEKPVIYSVTIYDNIGDQAMKRLVFELNLYQAECYADSKLVNMGYYWRFNSEIFKAIHNPNPWESIGNLKKVEKEWIHREPTFLGFMKFLEAKVKR